MTHARQQLLGVVAPPSHVRIDRRTGKPFPIPAWQAARERKAHEARKAAESKDVSTFTLPTLKRIPQ